MQTPSALLLDLDGTLVDSEPMHRAAYRSFFTARGWAHDEDTLSLFTGRRADDVFLSEPGPWAGEAPESLHAEVLSHLDLEQRPEPVAGGAELVHAVAAAGVPLAIVTSADVEWVAATVDRLLGLRERFSAVITREDVAAGKPHPACYRLACERLDVDPSHAAAVEDSPAGVRAAVAAGIGRVYGVTTTWSDEELDEAGATAVVPDLHALVPLFRHTRSSSHRAVGGRALPAAPSAPE